MKTIEAIEAELQSCVDRGMAFLDAYDPLWFQRINLSTFDMGSCERCCLGQLFGNYWRGTEQLWEEGESRAWTARRYGFTLPYDTQFQVWEKLTALWREQIQTRQQEFAKLCQVEAPIIQPVMV